MEEINAIRIIAAMHNLSEDIDNYCKIEWAKLSLMWIEEFRV